MRSSMDEHRIYQALPAIGRANAAGSKTAAPNRASTDPHEKPERSHLHHRLHANSLRTKGLHGSSGHHHHRQQAKDAVQSAVALTPPISFDHLLRRDKKSPDSSRRGSQTGPESRHVNDWNYAQQVEAEKDARRVVKPEEISRAKEQNAKRQEELRQSLKSVEEIGMTSTRKLDDTYYNILEKVSVLQSTISSLQQLSNQSRTLQRSFQKDTSELEKDAKDSLGAFGGFEGQEKTVDGLVTRLKDSKTKTEKLNERLEAARSRVEAYEKREREAQAKRRKRWHITWGTTVGIVVLVVAALVARHRRGVQQALDGVGERFGVLGGLIETAAAPLMTKVNESDILPPGNEPVDEDPLLHKLFDDL